MRSNTQRSLFLLLPLFLILAGQAFAENELVTVELQTVTSAEAAELVTEPTSLPEGHASPPLPLLDDITSASGQAFILGLAENDAGRFDLLTYHAITDTWVRTGTVDLPGTPTSIEPIARGF